VERQGLKERGAIDTRQQQCPLKEQLMSWVGKLWQHDYTHLLSLILDIGENEWLKKSSHEW
jgi:hypothetical protein